MKFGFEREYFVRNGGDNIVAPHPDLPRDECGYLAECRGPAKSDPLEAAYMFLCEEWKLYRKAIALGQHLDYEVNTTKLDKTFMRDMRRHHGKNAQPATQFNMYGKDFSVKDSWQRAGLHVHFSNEQEITTSTCEKCGKALRVVTVRGMLDIPRIVRSLDKQFACVIAMAKRLPGAYELKPYGFEYRSLPAHFAAQGGVVAVAEFLISQKLV